MPDTAPADQPPADSGTATSDPSYGELNDADQAIVDAAVAQMAAQMRPCPAHHPTARLVADLTLAEQLDAIASCLPCDWPASDVDPSSLAAGLLKQCAQALRHVIGQRDESVRLLRQMHVFCTSFVAAYDETPVQAEVTGHLQDVDGTPAYAEPACRCRTDLVAAGERCLEGACDVATEVTAALMEVGGFSEIDGDGTPATVLAGHVRELVRS